jgi:hypothetical protein
MSRSLVWQYFDVGGDESATCKECKNEIKRDTGNTSNLRRHLLNHHQEKHAELLQLEKGRQSEQDREEAVSV